MRSGDEKDTVSDFNYRAISEMFPSVCSFQSSYLGVGCLRMVLGNWKDEGETMVAEELTRY